MTIVVQKSSIIISLALSTVTQHHIAYTHYCAESGGGAKPLAASVSLSACRAVRTAFALLSQQQGLPLWQGGVPCDGLSPWPVVQFALRQQARTQAPILAATDTFGGSAKAPGRSLP